MKNRNLFNHIFTWTILACLFLFLLAQFNVFQGMVSDSNLGETIEGWVMKITLPVALFSAICMEVLLPVLDNKEYIFTNNKRIVLFIVKCVLLLGSIVPLVLNIGGFLNQDEKSEFITLGIFVVLYAGQFFINLDPKPDYDSEDEEEIEEDDIADDDDTDAEAVSETEEKEEN